MPGTQFTEAVISVILPVFNGEKYLSKSIQSVLGQTEKRFELLIMDDCSGDNSYSYLEKITDSRVQVFRSAENNGLFRNINYLISQAKTGLIKLWTQDDIMYPDCLEKTIEFHGQHPEIGFSYSNRDMINEDGSFIINNFEDPTPELISPMLHARISFFTGSIAGNIANVCINRNALIKIGGFNEEMKIAADFDMWVRLAKEHTTGHIKTKLIQLRNHREQLSRKEVYFIYRPKEDMHVYRNLLNYVDKGVREEGLVNLKRYKFVYYYTLMVKAFLKGKIKTAYNFYKELSSLTNIIQLSADFVRSKIHKNQLPEFMYHLSK